MIADQSASRFRQLRAVRQDTPCPCKIDIGRSDIVISGKHGLALAFSGLSPAFFR
jgi:hypothetical protein